MNVKKLKKYFKNRIDEKIKLKLNDQNCNQLLNMKRVRKNNNFLL